MFDHILEGDEFKIKPSNDLIDSNYALVGLNEGWGTGMRKRHEGVNFFCGVSAMQASKFAAWQTPWSLTRGGVKAKGGLRDLLGLFMLYIDTGGD